MYIVELHIVYLCIYICIAVLFSILCTSYKH